MISQGVILICVQQLRSPCSMLQVNCCALLWRALLFASVMMFVRAEVVGAAERFRNNSSVG